MHKILYIEDDALVVSIVRSVLSREGFEVISTETASEGLRLAMEENPVLILMDIWLPEGIDGWEATAQIKQTPELAHIPVIAITAQTSHDARARAIKAGVDAYITKPFDIRQLIEVIQGVLDESARV